LARKISSGVVLTKHSQVTFWYNHHHFIPCKLTMPLLHISDLGARFRDVTLCFIYCGAWNPSFGNFGHFQGQAHVGLFQMYLTSLPSHCRGNVEYLQEMICYF
jgi:hypothetical protein